MFAVPPFLVDLRFGRCPLQLALIGGQLFALSIFLDDQAVVPLPVDAFATRLLARPLNSDEGKSTRGTQYAILLVGFRI